MRRMSYVAAAAAGAIVPLAIALPAVAGTQSPVLTGVSSIMHDDWDEDDGDHGFIDENGDGIDDDFDDLNDDDDDTIDDPNEEDEYGNQRIDVEVAETTSTGDVSILISGENYPDFEDVVITSPSLVDNCATTDLDAVTTSTDRYGDFNLAVSGEECEVGVYQVIITEEDEYTSRIAEVDID